MSTHIKGVRDLDGQFAKMMSVKLACEAAGIGYPEEVVRYFRYPNERQEVLTKEMEEVDIFKSVTHHTDDSSEWWDIQLSTLPSEVKDIRVVHSY